MPSSVEQGGSEAKIDRIIGGLQQMLPRFTVTKEMYVELAMIISSEYETKNEQLHAVEQKLSQWKEDGSLRLRAPYRQIERVGTSTQSRAQGAAGPRLEPQSPMKTFLAWPECQLYSGHRIGDIVRSNHNFITLDFKRPDKLNLQILNISDPHGNRLPPPRHACYRAPSLNTRSKRNPIIFIFNQPEGGNALNHGKLRSVSL
ncbi:hypothetical protein AAMO2058_000953000 [Amorphochlora amoebiformis]